MDSILDSAVPVNSPDTSVSSGASALSSDIGGECSIECNKEKGAAKKRSKWMKKRDKKKEHRIEKNKISKEDFYNKNLEFKTWLLHVKHTRLEDISSSKAKAHFKTFVKKWNKKKLAPQYYRGIDLLWALGSPGSQSNWAMPGKMDITPGSLPENALEERYSRCPKEEHFSTFGKKTGAAVLKELQRTEHMLSEGKERVYDYPLSADERGTLSCDDTPYQDTIYDDPVVPKSRLKKSQVECVRPSNQLQLDTVITTKASSSDSTGDQDCPHSSTHHKNKEQPAACREAGSSPPTRDLSKQDSYISRIKSSSPYVVFGVIRRARELRRQRSQDASLKLPKRSASLYCPNERHRAKRQHSKRSSRLWQK